MKKSILFLILIFTFFSCKKEDTVLKNENSEATISLPSIRLEVYAFHGTRQCETCKNMKANTKATLDKYFAEELKSGEIIYQIIDVDDENNATLAEKFEATGTALMVNKVVDGKESISDWSSFAFDKASDSEIFIPELISKIKEALK